AGAAAARGASSLGYVIPNTPQQNVASRVIQLLLMMSSSSHYTEELLHVEKSMTGMAMCGGHRRLWRTRALGLALLAASGCQDQVGDATADDPLEGAIALSHGGGGSSGPGGLRPLASEPVPQAIGGHIVDQAAAVR